MRRAHATPHLEPSTRPTRRRTTSKKSTRPRKKRLSAHTSLCLHLLYSRTYSPQHPHSRHRLASHTHHHHTAYLSYPRTRSTCIQHRISARPPAYSIVRFASCSRLVCRSSWSLVLLAAGPLYVYPPKTPTPRILPKSSPTSSPRLTLSSAQPLHSIPHHSKVPLLTSSPLSMRTFSTPRPHAHYRIPTGYSPF